MTGEMITGMRKDKCPVCEKGWYTHGSALYSYYSCGHSKEKPIVFNKVLKKEKCLTRRIML